MWEKLLLGAAIAAVCHSVSVGWTTSSPSAPDTGKQLDNKHDQALSGKAEFVRFPPRTEAERDLENLLRGSDGDIDLALANWLIAADISEFQGVTREAYFTRLDAMTEHVRRDMVMMQKSGWHGTNPNDPATRCIRFCSAIIRLRFAYAEQFREENLTPAQMKALYADSDNIFLVGLLRTRRGTCVSMPLIYLVIGQRLGLPVHLVAIGKHYFVRWEEPGYRMNIEPTITEKIAITRDDSTYLEIEGKTRAEVKGSEMRNLTGREVVGQLFFTRSAYWATKGPAGRTEQRLDLTRAREFAPDDPAIKATYQTVFNTHNAKPERTSVGVSN